MMSPKCNVYNVIYVKYIAKKGAIDALFTLQLGQFSRMHKRKPGQCPLLSAVQNEMYIWPSNFVQVTQA